MEPGSLVAIVGPTASGKSALAIRLAKQFNGEIICADSRTVYRGMDIGTAKPTAEDQAQVPHYLLDVADPDRTYTVADFKKQAESAINDILSRGKIPILVGGSGLYIDSVLYNYQFSAENAPRDPQNPRHLAKGTNQEKPVLRGNTLVIGLQVDPELLKSRIADRVRFMVHGGLIEEVRHLSEEYGWDFPPMQAPAYKAFRGYVEGTKTKQQASEDFARYDAQLAKKQQTWFRRNSSIHWITDPLQAVELVTTFLNKNP